MAGLVCCLVGISTHPESALAHLWTGTHLAFEPAEREKSTATLIEGINYDRTKKFIPGVYCQRSLSSKVLRGCSYKLFLRAPLSDFMEIKNGKP